jgi:predicted TPR repeat methyltransferase
MTAGETELAIQNYAKSLELNPENTNAVRQLMRLTGVGE